MPAMGELRRDDGPADWIPEGDRPAKNADAHRAPPDLAEPYSIDRHKTTPAQRDFHRETGDGPVETEDVPYSINWNTGERRDRPAPGDKPETDHSPYADPPEDLNRDNSNLDARTIQRADAGEFEKFQPMDTGRRRGRGILDKTAEKSEEILELVHDGADAADSIFAHPPTHATVGSAPPPSDLMHPHYGTHTPGDTASALVAAAFAATMLSRKMHDKVSSRKEQHDGNG